MLANQVRVFLPVGIFLFLPAAFLVFVGCTTPSNNRVSDLPDPPPANSASAKTASTANDPPPAVSAIENGKKLFTQRGCIGCHTINGNGGKVGPDLSNEANAGHSAQWLTTQIRDPKKNDPKTLMPAYDTLTDQQVNDLIRYLLSLSTGHPKAAQTRPIRAEKAPARSSETTSFSMEEAGQRWSQVCGQCHNLRSPSEYSDTQWQVAIHHMRVRVPLTGREQEEILAFLQANN